MNKAVGNAYLSYEKRKTFHHTVVRICFEEQVLLHQIIMLFPCKHFLQICHRTYLTLYWPLSLWCGYIRIWNKVDINEKCKRGEHTHNRIQTDPRKMQIKKKAFIHRKSNIYTHGNTYIRRHNHINTNICASKCNHTLVRRYVATRNYINDDCP